MDIAICTQNVKKIKEIYNTLDKKILPRGLLTNITCYKDPNHLMNELKITGMAYNYAIIDEAVLNEDSKNSTQQLYDCVKLKHIIILGNTRDTEILEKPCTEFVIKGFLK